MLSRFPKAQKYYQYPSTKICLSKVGNQQSINFMLSIQSSYIRFICFSLLPGCGSKLSHHLFHGVCLAESVRATLTVTLLPTFIILMFLRAIYTWYYSIRDGWWLVFIFAALCRMSPFTLSGLWRFIAGIKINKNIKIFCVKVKTRIKCALVWWRATVPLRTGSQEVNVKTTIKQQLRLVWGNMAKVL